MPAHSQNGKHQRTRRRMPNFLYTSRFMARRNVLRQAGEDVREHPTYSIQEGALYVHVPESTLRSWVLGRTYPVHGGVETFRPLIKASDPKRNLLSFYNIA